MEVEDEKHDQGADAECPPLLPPNSALEDASADHPSASGTETGPKNGSEDGDASENTAAASAVMRKRLRPGVHVLHRVSLSLS